MEEEIEAWKGQVAGSGGAGLESRALSFQHPCSSGKAGLGEVRTGPRLGEIPLCL